MTAAKRVLRYLCSTSGLGLVLGGRRPVVLRGHADASWADDQTTQRSSQGYTFSLGSGSVSWRSTCSSSVLSSSCEAEIYAGAMAAQVLRWLTYLLTDLGEPPRSPPVLYVDNKAMLALCREHRLEHRTKHIALRYFLARELQQRGQLRLAYMASEANTADIFTKALPPGDHQRFCMMLGFPTYIHVGVHPNGWMDVVGVIEWLDGAVKPYINPKFGVFLLCDRADGLSLFDLTSGVSPAPPATTDSTVRSQWATRDAAARLAVRRHLPTTERAHFSQYRSAQTLYDAVVARYSSPATAALSRLFLPYLFPDLVAFSTVADLITHLRTSDARYRAALPAEFCAKNPPPLYLTLYYVVTRLPDSLRVVRDHFLSVCPTTLTVDLLEERLLAAEQSIVAVGASRGDPRTPIFEGCSPSPLLPSVASAATADLGGFELCGDFVIHPEFALLCFTGLVFLVVPNILLVHSFLFLHNLTPEVKKKFGELNLVPAVIPAGCTLEIQPLDIAVNRSFKAAVRQLYQEWFEREGVDTLTKKGNIKKPPVELTLKWISAAWKSVPKELIQRAFLTCGISNALDGSQDKLCLQHRRDELEGEEVDMDDEIAAHGFFYNNVEEPESDSEADPDDPTAADD
ncbi:unnamed protein product [Closterium sp. NIES-54]